jgi:hypothetical protein
MTNPFCIGQLDPSKGYVHVLDDVALNVLMNARDTISDFVDYLSKKDALVTSGKLIGAAGEEDLLAYFLTHMDGCSPRGAQD